MSIFNAVILGLVQGITEFLPVSSSGHLVIFNNLLNSNSSLIFVVFLHFASLMAVLLFFRKKIFSLILSLRVLFVKEKSATEQSSLNYIFYLIVATVPAAVIGLLLESKIEAAFSSVKFAGAGLLVTAAVLFFSDRFSANHQVKETKYSFSKAVFIGLAQAIAIFPGISRSGSTVAAGLFKGFSRRDAAEFSFLLSIPIIAAGFIFKIKDLLIIDISAGVLLVSGLSCFLAAYLAIAFFIKIITKYSLKYFSLYCFLLGLWVLFFR